MSINGRPYHAVSLQDTVPLPIHGRVVIRLRFTGFTGKFVFLSHEDHGMMAVVEVVDPRRAREAALRRGVVARPGYTSPPSVAPGSAATNGGESPCTAHCTRSEARGVRRGATAESEE